MLSIRNDRGADRTAELFPPARGSFRIRGDAKGPGRAGSGNSEPPIRIEPVDGARVIAHGLLRNESSERLALDGRDRGNVDERVGKQRMGQLVETDSGQTQLVVVRVGGTRSRDQVVDR